MSVVKNLIFSVSDILYINTRKRRSLIEAINLEYLKHPIYTTCHTSLVRRIHRNVKLYLQINR